MKKYRIIIIILFHLICLSFVTYAGQKEENFTERVLAIPAKNFESYTFSPKSSLLSRVESVPSFVLDYLKKMDNRPDYSSYTPSESERTLITEYILKLPPLHQNILKKRLISIYFVNNFLGSGMADFVLSRNSEIYTILVFNPIIINTKISKWLTYRENTCFINNSSEHKIKIDFGEEFTGLMYGLLHETSHIVDYVLHYTPFVEPDLTKINGYEVKDSDFVQGIWYQYHKPLREYRYTKRKQITFYGLNDGPKINETDAIRLYEKLVKTPFVSLYGSLNWAEDFAELITFYHLTEKLHQPYKINCHEKGKLVFSYSPMKFLKVQQRLHTIQGVYSSDKN